MAGMEKRMRSGSVACSREVDETMEDGLESFHAYEMESSRLMDLLVEGWKDGTCLATVKKDVLLAWIRNHVESKRCVVRGEDGHRIRLRRMEIEKNLSRLLISLESYEEDLQRIIYESDVSEGISPLVKIDTEEKLSEAIAYAQRISYSTFAPPGFDSGRCGNVGFYRPAPQAEQLVASRLHKDAWMESNVAGSLEGIEDRNKEKDVKDADFTRKQNEVDVGISLPPTSFQEETKERPYVSIDLNPEMEVLEDYESPTDTSEDSE